MFGRVIQAVVVLAFGLAACGKRQLGGDPPPGSLGGAIWQGEGGSGNAGGAGGAGGVPKVPSGCIFNGTGAPVPIVDIVDPGPVLVACQGTARSPAVIGIGVKDGQGFDWYASVVPNEQILRPDITAGTACAGHGTTGVGFIAAFPDVAGAGDNTSATLAIDTTYAWGLPQIQAPISAVVVPSEFELDLVSGTPVPPGTARAPLVVDFGAVAVGGAGDAYVQVRNLGTAPLMVVHPASPLSDPFSFRDWSSSGEDAPPTPPVAPGESATVHFTFGPTVPGSYSAELAMTPFQTSPGPGCGSSVHVTLRGTTIPPP